MEVMFYKLKLGQNQVQNEEKKAQIRTIKLPGYIYHYILKENKLIYTIEEKQDLLFEGDGDCVLSIYKENVQQEHEKVFQLSINNNHGIFLLENYALIFMNNHIIKYNTDHFNWLVYMNVSLRAEDTSSYCQINKKSFMTIAKVDNRIRIYQLRNLKISHTLCNWFGITSAQYYKYIVEATNHRTKYYYNTRMTKQIRKYDGCLDFELTFNSNYLFVPSFSQKKEYNQHIYLAKLTIYDIQSMKIKGTIKLQTDRNQFGYSSCIFIRDFNVIGVLYSDRLDLYDFTTLKCIDSQNIAGQEYQQQSMKYDEHNGLTIFIQ